MLKRIDGILLDPVGCLAEFPPEPFHEIAAIFVRFQAKPGESGSAAYWHLLTLSNGLPLPAPAEALETQAVNAATIFDDVRPALTALRTMGVRLSIASSLSGTAISRFLERHCLADFFSGISNRDNAGGILAAPLVHALRAAPLAPETTIFLTDAAEGIQTAKRAGVHPILMMNDPDEARRLASHNPAGGVVSLHELPDFVRLLAAQNGSEVRGR